MLFVLTYSYAFQIIKISLHNFFVSFGLKKALLKWNSHTINFTRFKCTVQ